VEKIRNIAESHSGKVNGVHELKTRRAGDTNFLEFHLVFDEDIKLREAHHIADEIEMRIRELEKSRWIINIHLDPVDDSHRDHKLGKLR
jgi:ferrous-iron efflux pump FieF